MNMDLRTLLLAATVATCAPVAPASTALNQGAGNNQIEDKDPGNGSKAATDSQAEGGDTPKTTSKSQVEANSKEALTDSTTLTQETKQGTEPAAHAKKAKKHSKNRGLDDELRCLALNIYHEARSQSKTGQKAVAAVTLNRVKAKSFPNSVCKVVRQGGVKRNRCQFSWWCDGRNDQPTERAAWRNALDIANESLLGVRDDPTNGALFYHAKSVRPSWSNKFKRTAKIGDHLFYKPAKRRSVKVASAK